MKFDIRADVDDFKKQCDKIVKKQLPYATSKAINEVANKAKKVIEQEIKQNIDNPVSYTQKSVFVAYSSKSKKPIRAIVGIKDNQAKYLRFVEYGGTSPASGKAKPVPTSNMKNKFGNIPRGKVKRVLSQKDKYFSGTPVGGKRPGGIYQRTKKGLKMLAVWEPSTKHHQTTRFGDRVGVVVRRNIKRELTKQINAALR